MRGSFSQYIENNNVKTIVYSKRISFGQHAGDNINLGRQFLGANSWAPILGRLVPDLPQQKFSELKGTSASLLAHDFVQSVQFFLTVNHDHDSLPEH
jgi:hypothetical protein